MSLIENDKMVDITPMVDITQMGDFGSLVGCMICDKPFEVRANDHRIICPSCKRGLKKMLEVRKRRAEGKWIKGDMYTCDQCGYEMVVGDGAYHYCPNCGAKMEGEE